MQQKWKIWLKNRVKLPFKTSISGLMLCLAQIFKELECWCWNSVDFQAVMNGLGGSEKAGKGIQIEKLQVQLLKASVVLQCSGVLLQWIKSQIFFKN